jgi:hypothetical protein
MASVSGIPRTKNSLKCGFAFVFIVCYSPFMPRKPAPKPDDPEESKRFVDMAREVEADESEEALERAFKKIVPPRQPARRQKA